LLSLILQPRLMRFVTLVYSFGATPLSDTLRESVLTMYPRVTFRNDERAVRSSAVMRSLEWLSLELFVHHKQTLCLANIAMYGSDKVDIWMQFVRNVTLQRGPCPHICEVGINCAHSTVAVLEADTCVALSSFGNPLLTPAIELTLRERYGQRWRLFRNTDDVGLPSIIELAAEHAPALCDAWIFHNVSVMDGDVVNFARMSTRKRAWLLVDDVNATNALLMNARSSGAIDSLECADKLELSQRVDWPYAFLFVGFMCVN
jgi:hypothetical protein